MDGFTYVLAFIEGILTFVSPCILPLLPVYLVYLAGAAGAKPGNAVLRSKGLLVNSLGFITGFTLIFVALGATATALGGFLRDHRDWLRIASGLIMIGFGLHFMGFIRLKFLDFQKRLEYDFRFSGFLGAVVFGLVFAVGWTPCTGLFLGSALLMAGNTDTVGQGMLLLLVFSLGLGLPFLVVAAAFDRARGVLEWFKKHSRAIGIISGIVLIAAGILILFDRLKYLAALSW